MKVDDEVQNKVFVDQEGMAVIKCPECSKQKSTRVDPSAIRDKEIRDNCLVRCTCQTRFAVKLEFRKDSRKNSKLNGEYLGFPKGKPRGKLTVVNVSQNGLGVQFAGTDQFHIGDEILILFTLDDNIDSLIEKKAIVRCVKQDYIGCEFLGSTPPGKAFGDFLASEPDDITEEVEEKEFDWTGSFTR